MDVKDQVSIPLQHHHAEDSHEPGKNNEADIVGLQYCDEFRIEGFARLALRRVKYGVEAVLPCESQAGGGLDIADHDSDFSVKFVCLDIRSDCFKIGSTAGKKNSDPAIARPDLHVR